MVMFHSYVTLPEGSGGYPAKQQWLMMVHHVQSCLIIVQHVYKTNNSLVGGLEYFYFSIYWEQ